MTFDKDFKKFSEEFPEFQREDDMEDADCNKEMFESIELEGEWEILNAIKDKCLSKQRVREAIENARNHCYGEPDKMQNILLKELKI